MFVLYQQVSRHSIIAHHLSLEKAPSQQVDAYRAQKTRAFVLTVLRKSSLTIYPSRNDVVYHLVALVLTSQLNLSNNAIPLSYNHLKSKSLAQQNPSYLTSASS